MRAWFVAMLWLMAITGSGSADQIVVRGGEHGSFTRLTVGLDQNVTWEVDARDRLLLLRFATFDPDFDFSHTFARIGRERISAVTFVEGALRLVLNCECQTRIFRAAPNLVAIDVVDPKTEDPITNPVISDQTARQTEARPHKRDLGGGDEVVAFNDVWLEHLLKEQLQSEIVAAAKRRAVSGRPGGSEKQSIVMKNPNPQIRVRNGSLSQETTKKFKEFSIEPEPSCPEERELAFLSQSLDEDPIARLANLRRDVFTMTGRVDASSAFDLVEYYTFLGLGEEALAFADHFRLGGRRAQLVRAAASFMANMPPSQDIWDSSQDCGPRATFWSFVASSYEVAEPPDESMVNSFVQFFAELSPHLQRIALDRLIERLDMENHADAIARFHALTGRQGVSTEPALDAYANILDQAVEGEAALAKTSRRVESDDIIALVNRHWETGTPLSSAKRDLLDSYRFEIRGDQDSDRLGEASVRAALLSGDFLDARDQLLKLGDGVSADLKSDYLAALVATESNAKFLVAAQQISLDKWDVMGDLLLPVADRAAVLGFPQLAAALGRVGNETSFGSNVLADTVDLPEGDIASLLPQPTIPGRKSKFDNRSKIFLSDVRKALDQSARLRVQSVELLRTQTSDEQP